MTVLVDNVPLIGIYSPYPGAGKSTLAKFLEVEYGFKIVKMADPLKAMLRAYYESCGLNADEIYERLEGNLKGVPDPYLEGRTPRHAMQTLGTEWGRGQIGDEVWVRAFLTKQFVLREQDNPVVCDDMRFPNEFETIYMAGGLLVRVSRPGIENPKAPWWKRIFSKRWRGHSSEGSLDHATFDFEAVNTYNSAEDFVKAVGPRVAEAAFRRATRQP